MQALKKFSTTAAVILVLALVIYFVVGNYSFVFSDVITGRIIAVERLTQPAAILANGQTAPQALFSFSIAIEDEKTKKVYTASSEDRQWGVAKYCARAKVRFYPYPPWDFQKAGTYFNARVEEPYDCKPASETPAHESVQQPSGQ